MSTIPIPTEQSLGVYQLKVAFATMDESLTRNAVEGPDGLAVLGEEGASAISEATRRLGSEAQNMLGRIQSKDARDEFVASLQDDEYLATSLHELIDALNTHNHSAADRDSDEPMGEGAHWLPGEPVNLSLWATLKVAQRALWKVIKVAIHGPEVQEDLSERPARALNNALSDIQLAGWKFIGAMKRLERARRHGQIPDAHAGFGLCYVRFDDEPIEQMRLEVSLEMMAINPFFPWMKDRGIAARSVFEIARGVVLGRSLIGPVRTLMDDSKDPNVKQWTTQLLILMDKMLEAISKGSDAPPGVAPPLVSSLGAGSWEALEPLLRELPEIRQQLHAVDRQMCATGSATSSPAMSSMTANALEEKIGQAHQHIGAPASEVALMVVLNDLRSVYANIPAWRGVDETRALKRSTALSMLNAMGQGIKSIGALREYKAGADGVLAHSGSPADPLLIGIAEYGAVLAHRGMRAVAAGGSQRLDLAFNPGAKAKSVELSSALSAAESRFRSLRLALESETMPLTELLTELESDQKATSGWQERFMSALGVVPLSPKEERQKKEEPAFEFRMDGNQWKIRFRGRSASMGVSKGLADIAAILRENDPRGVDVLELDSAPARKEVLGADKVLDEEARQQFKDRIEEIRDKRAIAEEARDENEISKLDLELKEIERALQLATGKGDRSRPLGGTRQPEQAAREAVRARVKRAIEQFRKLDPPWPDLANYLRDSIHFDGTRVRFVSADPAVKWELL